MITIDHEIILKYRNEDFRVSEVSLLPGAISSSPEGKGYTLLTVTKDGYTTFEAIAEVADYFQLDKHSVHCQGLKDEDGITEQLLSVNRVIAPDDTTTFNKKHTSLPKGCITLSLRAYSNQPLQEKCLHGNVFNLRLRNIKQADAERLINFCQGPLDFVCANYYDQQRFGLPGGPFLAHKIGQAIVNGDWDAADILYRDSGNVDLDYPNGSAADQQQGLLIDKIDTRKLAFFVAAYGSLEWNEALSTTIKSKIYTTIFDGHRVRITDGRKSLPLLTATTSYKLDDNNKVTARDKTRASFVSTTVFASNKQRDTDFKDRYTVDLQFFLPAGSYATMLVKQLVASALFA